MAYPKGMSRYRTESGFTIIEILITMSIAGLIMVVVFIAIPQLQRNARNEARKRDVARLMASVRECVAHNRGRFRNCYTANAVHFEVEEFSQYTEFGVVDLGTSGYPLTVQTASGIEPSRPYSKTILAEKAVFKVDGPVIIFNTKCIDNSANQSGANPVDFTSSSLLEGGGSVVGYCVSSNY